MTPLRLLTSDSDLHDDTSGQETARPGFLAPPHCTVPLPSPSGSAKIRFAPLPEIRPRSYSTGNSLFLEDGEIDETERNWVRRETNMQTDSAIETDEELDDEDRSLGRRSSGEITRGREARIRNNASTQNSSNHIFSKDRWLMDGQVVGKSSAPTTPSGEKDGMMGAMLSSISSRGEATSITLKILRPLSFGLVKKEKKKKDSKRASSSDTGGKGDNFPRWDSMESDVSRLSSVSGISGMSGASSGRRAATAAGGGSSYGGGNGERTWGSEGGAIRRSKNDDDDGITGSGRRNWEQSAVQSGPSVNSHQYAPSRRANYPPVAQRSKKKAKPATAPTFSKVVEPKFVEWGFERAGSTGGGGMGNNRKNGINVDEDEEEDGSGLAWIKRRKEERRIKAEEAEMKKIAEEVKEAQGRLREGGESESAPPIIRLIPESPGVVEPKQGFASLQEAAHRLGTDPTANAEASTSSVSLVLSSGPPTPTSDARSERSTPSDELPDPISSHHNTSAPTSPNSLVASLPLLTTTPVVIPPVPSRSIAPHIRKHSTSPDGRKESEESEEADDVDAASDDEEEESSGEESDLDEDELAIEEEMKEKARITALSAGAFPIVVMRCGVVLIDILFCSDREILESWSFARRQERVTPSSSSSTYPHPSRIPTFRKQTKIYFYS